MVLDEKRVPKEIYDWLISESINFPSEDLKKRGSTSSTRKE